ncbi:5-(carboxyamino)imidazole ribonucleotide mutase [Candidatus Gottesmanbacteria bacterium RIFCSPHIGHO2_02_FULL_39_11]|uniref:N5-carboxyaminoimidazole ribonucleotide mutase n=1 Tax=Candidatus Gottesmanbacteria bacterium RIFCSPHIGHO2_02_FULL_39_11 TaxID=1798382 RepID=A0A1F5ZW86_9BACT|nr:MAG: 5-(carboxyamino)imidazole ribonucleotide mutase [Candidatus Gottesmanbacteria bacterium RIFCSPHIGHO2_02_FULL_39_11]
MKKTLVGILMGSDSDLPIMKEAGEIMEEFGIGYEMGIISAHRTPDVMYEYAGSAYDRGLKVIIAGAGGAAHVAGMIASLTSLPVIGVPIQSKTLNGVDSLYSIVQMPPGVPVATVSINGAKNAGLLAVQILSIVNTELYKKMTEYKKRLHDTVVEKSKKLETAGFKKYKK